MKRTCLIVISLLFVLLPISAAQDAVFCGDLPAADCDLLAANHAAMRDLDTVAYDLSLTLSGFTESDNPFDLMLTSDGVMRTGQATLRSALPALFDADSVDALLELAEPALNTLAAEGQIRIAVPVEDSEQPTAFSARMRLTEGHVYLTSLFLQLAVPGLGRGDWLDLDLMNTADMTADLLSNPARLQALVETLESRGLPLPPGDLRDGDLNGVPFAQVVAHFVQMGRTLNRDLLTTPDFQSRFVAIQRLPDQTVAGEPVAVFEMTLNYPVLVEADIFQQALSDTLTLMASHEMSPDEIEQAKMLLLELLAAQTMTITRTVGLNDSYTDSVIIVWSLQLDTDMVQTITAGTLTAPRAATIIYEQHLSDHNQPVTVAAPAATRSALDLVRGFLGDG